MACKSNTSVETASTRVTASPGPALFQAAHKNFNDQACIAVMRKSKITLPFMFTAYDEVPICTLASEAQTAEEADGAVGMTKIVFLLLCIL